VRYGDDFLDGTTFGMEFDCGDYDRRIPLPPPHTYCPDEVASVSKAGIGADPSIRYNLYGGEVQFAPQATEEALLKEVLHVNSTCLRGDLFFPGTIHMHLRIPRLLERPDLIKKLVMWTQNWWPFFGPAVFKSTDGESNQGSYNDWLIPCTWECKNLVYPEHSIVRMLNPEVDTPAKIALALHNNPKDWKNEWHKQNPIGTVKRPAINFGHLAINETIEFRVFMATTNVEMLKNIIAFPLDYIRVALNDELDPLRICRGKKYQAEDYAPPVYNGLAEATNGFHNDQRRQIGNALIRKQITVEDLGFPPYWINRGFQ